MAGRVPPSAAGRCTQIHWQGHTDWNTIDNRAPPTLIWRPEAAFNDFNTLTRGAESAASEEPGGAPDPSKPSKNETKRLERGQKNPNHIMTPGFFPILRIPRTAQKMHDRKHVVFENSSPGTCFFMSKSFFLWPQFFKLFYRYMTVTRPFWVEVIRLKSTQALGILGFWGSVNR